ncbi:MAG: hypothetical protein AMS21_05095 [Gemmatimonas sp. SG8_38_2]|nr:MAG: hypothetical protein AMS21_05095 [Gemmatimonas sp. SG8_38_2]
MEDLGWLFITINVVGVVAIMVLGIGMIVLGRAILRIVRNLKAAEDALTTIGRDARPVLDRARAIGENLNFLVMSVRKEVEGISETISYANERLEDALESADERVQELSALIDVVQGEVEDTVLTATSTLRGIRTGAKLLRRRRNDDPADDEEADEE